MNEQMRGPKQEKGPELKRPDGAIKDLEPDNEQGDAVKGGTDAGWDLKGNQKQG